MANFQVAAVFSDHMVLQRNKNISIFGTADTGNVIHIRLLNSRKDVLAENKTTTTNGHWKIQLPPQTAQTNCTLQISPEQTGNNAKLPPTIVTFTDIAIGEVWLAGGQSNMEFELQNCTEGPDALADKSDPNVRFYYTNKIGWMDEHFFEAEKSTYWQTWNSEWKKAWSAVGYFFAKKLAQDLNCVVGIIGCNWGGTSASAWMRKEYLEKDDELRTYLTEYEEATAGKSIEQQCKEYDNYEKENALWQEKCAKMYAENPTISWADVEAKLGKCPWPGPKSCKNPYRPTGLYDCMLARILPYTIKGVIWYQGESDDHKPSMYYKLFSNMIDNWRTDWADLSLPFVFVQLPNHRYEQDKDFKHWCFIREAQAKVHQTVKNAFMTCALDLGQYNDIHPKAKKELAERLEKNALSNVYHKISAKKVLSPMLESALSINGQIIITCNNCEDGFDLIDDIQTLNDLKKMEAIQGNSVSNDYTGFEIAGADKVYYPASVEFGTEEGKLNTIILSSQKVAEPLYARYAWSNYTPVTVYGKDGLPLAPFRTSELDTQTTTEHANIQQIMTV